MHKFSERRTLNQFDGNEVQRVLNFVTRAYRQEFAKPGSVVLGMSLYGRASDADVPADLIDAAMRFLSKYGFVVDVGKAKWIVRKRFETSDIEAACEVVRMMSAPKLDHETAFETLRRVRALHENAA